MATVNVVPTAAQLAAAGFVELPNNAVVTHDNGWALHTFDGTKFVAVPIASSSFPLEAKLYVVPTWNSPRKPVPTPPPVVTPPVASTTLLGTYSGGSASQAASDSTTYLKKTPREIQLEFLDPNQTWAAGMESSWYINNLAGSQHGIMSIPMLVGPTVGTPGASGTGQSTSPSAPDGSATPTLMTLADVGKGIWDVQFTKVFQAIASVRPDCILRIGWEMYGTGSFFNWSGPALSADHKAAFIDLVNCARKVSSKFQFDWNGAIACNGYDPITAGSYPGDEYVDFITADVYQNWNGTSPGASGWASIADLLQPGFDFAKAHGKKWGSPEFGLWPTNAGGSGDDPAWIQAAYNWVKTNKDNIGYILYFNNPGSSMSLQQCPKSAVVFENTFGSNFVAPIGPSAPVSVGTLTLNEDFSIMKSLDASVFSSDWFSATGKMNNVTTDPKNVSVVNGKLLLTLSSSTDGALVSTNPGGGANPGFLFQYGYVEASITFPSVSGKLVNWPAFWTECQDWQNGEEFDIAEVLGGSMTTNYHPRTSGVDAAQNSGTITGDWTGKHIYGMLWEPGVQKMYFDGNLMYSRTVNTSGKPQYLIINHGVDSSSSPSIGASVIIDYVRVWAQ